MTSSISSASSRIRPTSFLLLLSIIILLLSSLPSTVASSSSSSSRFRRSLLAVQDEPEYEHTPDADHTGVAGAEHHELAEHEVEHVAEDEQTYEPYPVPSGEDDPAYEAQPEEYEQQLEQAYEPEPELYVAPEEHLAEHVPEHIPEHVAEHVAAEHIPEHVPEHIPEHVAEHVPEHVAAAEHHEEAYVSPPVAELLTEELESHHIQPVWSDATELPIADIIDPSLEASMSSALAPLLSHFNVLVSKAPEHGYAHLICPPLLGHISVIDSSFGSGQGSPDFTTGLVPHGLCHVHLDLSQANCQNQASCAIHAELPLLGAVDPCPGVFKRLVVTYKCTRDAVDDHTPLHDAHSPALSVHDFIAPAGATYTHLDSRDTFFSHFFANQQASGFRFHVNSSRSIPGADGAPATRRNYTRNVGADCEGDAHKFCGGVLKACVGHFDCATQCLTEHAPFLSEKCKDAHPCFEDIKKLCPATVGGANNIMRCLKSNAKKLSPHCTKVHPCLLDANCHRIDYDNQHVQAHQPLFKHLPTYMKMLTSARAQTIKKGGRVDPHAAVPFMHLVLPGTTRAGVDHVEPKAHDAILLNIHSASLSKALRNEDDDEDAINEFDIAYDVHTLGTGKFSHISLHSSPLFAIDIHIHSNIRNGHTPQVRARDGITPGGDGGFDVALWAHRKTSNQMFDINEHGQIFWMHSAVMDVDNPTQIAADQEARLHYCLSTHPARPQELFSDLCEHITADAAGEKRALTQSEQAQTWHFTNNQLIHTSTGQCVSIVLPAPKVLPIKAGAAASTTKSTDAEHKELPLPLLSGTHLRLVDCLTAPLTRSSAAPTPASILAGHQQWTWATGELVELSPGAFAKHQTAVAAKRAQAIAHRKSGKGKHHTLAAAGAHASKEHAHEEAEIRLLQAEIMTLVKNDRTRDAALNRVTDEVHEDEQRIEVMSEEHYKENKEKLERHQKRVAFLEAQLAERKRNHFFTPVTIIISSIVVALLAFVFRLYLFPFIVKKYTQSASQQYYSRQF